MPDVVCCKCGAYMWFEERVQKDYNPSQPLFSLCFKQGRVKIAYLDFPEELNELYYGNDLFFVCFFENMSSTLTKLFDLHV